MKRIIILAALAALFVVSAVPAVAEPTEKVELCHVTGLGNLQPLSVAPAAVAAHLDHGDLLQGADIPGMPGYVVNHNCVPFVPAQPGELEFTPFEWGIALNTGGDEDDDGNPIPEEGIHTIFTIAGVSPLTVVEIDYLSGRLVWDETEVDLCNVDVRFDGEGFVAIGDIFQTTEGCGDNPNATQEAFDEYGFDNDVTACVAVTSGGVFHEYCALLEEFG